MDKTKQSHTKSRQINLHTVHTALPMAIHPKIQDAFIRQEHNIIYNHMNVVVVCHDQVRLQVSQGFRCRDS